jgi:hypothetical protein
MTEWPGDLDEHGNELSVLDKVIRYIKANDPLGDPPQVPSDGKNPPLETYPVLLAPQGLIIVDGSDKTLQRFLKCRLSSPIHKDLRDAWFWALAPEDDGRRRFDPRAARGKPRAEGRNGGLRRITNTGFWRREPVVILPPGASKKVSTWCHSGMTDTQSQKLSASVGVKVPIGFVELGAKLTGSLNRTVTVTEEVKREIVDELHNNSNRTRRYAVWHRIERIQVEALVSPASTADASNTGTDGRNTYSFGWKTIADESYEPSLFCVTTGEVDGP